VGASGARRNQVLATVTPGERTGSLLLICEPEGGAWVDWFMVDDGTNLENIEAITRAITSRISERRKGEELLVRETATEKELTVAKLSLLHAQVEPPFPLQHARERSDPHAQRPRQGRADARQPHRVPAPLDAARRGSGLDPRARSSSARAPILEILKIRMGERLSVQIQVPESLHAVPMPPMMLQTLVENAIKHGLEPIPGGGTIWVLARASDTTVAVTVADDGRGFSEEGGGTGIGLKNVRERLRLAYGDRASFSIVANFPKGVAANDHRPQAGEAEMPRCVVAEDELLLRDDLVAQLRRAWPELEIAAACEDGGEALEGPSRSIVPRSPSSISACPGLTGLEVAAAAAEASPANAGRLRHAYNQYAIDAFDRGAVDYLLKPIAPDRLAETVRRVKARLASGASDPSTAARSSKSFARRFPGESRGPAARLAHGERGQGDPAHPGRRCRLLQGRRQIHRGDDRRGRGAHPQAHPRPPRRLDPAIFKQIHRSTIVNMKAVAAITRDDAGRGTMRLKNRPETLAVSLTYMPLFKNM
jgi:DNA-binding LytR/AlgR family response regulator